jgi:Glutaredoxin-like domain (DUF836)
VVHQAHRPGEPPPGVVNVIDGTVWRTCETGRVNRVEPLMPPEVVPAAGVRVLVLGKDGCHLCDVAKEVVAAVCADAGAAWEERSIAGIPSLEREYGDKIPVIFVDGRLHEYWRVDAAGLRKALGEKPVRNTT